MSRLGRRLAKPTIGSPTSYCDSGSVLSVLLHRGAHTTRIGPEPERRATGFMPAPASTPLPSACRRMPAYISPAPHGAASAEPNAQGQHGGRAVDAKDP